MIKLPGYTLQEEIFKSTSSTLYRGFSVSDNKPVVVKMLNSEYPSKKELTDFYREYEITNKLRGDNIICVYGIQKNNNSLCIVMEDIGGQSISRKTPGSSLTLSDKIGLSIKVTNALIQIHQQNVIHKDVNPSNVIWNESSGEVKIIDFGISTELSLEICQYTSTNILEGTIPYLSPEQTGRMNRPVDYRTDLYSLGVMLYELFTGRLPFIAHDDMEMIYCHLAKMATPPAELNPEIPPSLSAVVMKLLSKTAEDRYQSARGVKNDLEYCLKHLVGEVEAEPFIPGKNDIGKQFQVSHKMYGRDADVALLTNHFERSAQGNGEFVLVGGYSGIGKSSLINEIRKPATLKKSIIVSGKFDQLGSTIPYSAITQAFSGWIKQLLLESDKKLLTWKSQLLESLGQNGQIIIDIIPELEQIIGVQPPVVEQNPVESKNRFQMTFKEFIKVFANNEHPLVVILDDLQWGDFSTFDLLKYLLGSNDLKYVLFIGAYRVNEVENGHPLLPILEDVQSLKPHNEKSISHLKIKPLDFKAINQLIADTFRCSPESTEALSRLVINKTEGNPFFTNQILKNLYYQHSVTFDADKRKWVWDLEKVERAQISDNVVDLLVNDIESLPESTVEVLKWVACIGNQFDIAMVAALYDKSILDLDVDIRLAMEKGFIYSIDMNYRNVNKYSLGHLEEIQFRFSHDRVQQAVYSLTTEGERNEKHLKIGQFLLKSLNRQNVTSKIFDLVHQLNYGRSLINDFNERNELSELNEIAGKKALKATAFKAASNYYGVARTLLSEKEWENQTERRFTILLQQATAALLSGQIDNADDLCTTLSRYAKNNREKGLIANVKVALFEFQGRQLEAIEEIRQTLNLFGIQLPEKQDAIQGKIHEGIGNMQAFLAKNTVDALINLPEMIDEDTLMMMQLLFQLIPPALQVNPPLYILASLMMFNLTVKHGTTALSSKCFTDCGVIQGAMLGNYHTGYQLGEAAFALISKYTADALKPSVYFVFTYISYWSAPFSESCHYYDLSFKAGIETGDVLHAAYALSHKVHLMLNTGSNLTTCLEEANSAITVITEFKTAIPLLLVRIIRNAICKYIFADEQDDVYWSDIEKSDKELLATIESMHNTVFIGRFFQYNTLFSVIQGDWQSAEKWNQMAETIIFAGLSDFPVVDHYLFQGLIITQKWSTLTLDERDAAHGVLSKILLKLQTWMENESSNFAHKYYLLAAKIAIVEQKPLEIITEFFLKATESIVGDDFMHMKALCNELQGIFWIERGYETIGKTFIREAHYLYEKWGASRKKVQLEKEYPVYFSGSFTPGIKTSVRHTTSGSSIDVASLLKSTRAISSEIKSEKLLATLIHTIIENAGAQRGCLLLLNESENHLYREVMQDTDQIAVIKSTIYTECNDICTEIVQYVARTHEDMVISDACNDKQFLNNNYIHENGVQSVLCMPVFLQNSFKGVVYLENNLTDNVFTEDRLEILKMLSSQAAISIENARLYENMEEKVKERTIQLKDANEKLLELSLHDPLTNLHNRRYTYEVINDFTTKYINDKVRIYNHANKRSQSLERTIMGVFLIDIDFFKEVNDTYGHQIGDSVLITLSNTLKTIIRSDDFIVRWGGEEFLIVLKNTQPEYLKIFAQKVIATICDTPIIISDTLTIKRTCSLGYTELPLCADAPDLLTLEQSINLSDYALYCAKEKGRNCAAHFKINKKPEQICNMKELFIHLSKDTDIENECFKIEFIQP